MKFQWNDKEPIYIQLKNQICEMILNGELSESEPLPSVRQVTVDYKLNPATVKRAWKYLLTKHYIQQSSDGRYFIKENAHESLIKSQHKTFMNIEWPQVEIKIKNLEIDIEVLTDSLH